MDQSPNPKLDELLELTRENNKILRSMRRAQRWAAVMRVIYWIILIGVSVGAFYFLQPYLKQVTDLYNNSRGALGNFTTLLNNFSSSTPKQ